MNSTATQYVSASTDNDYRTAKWLGAVAAIITWIGLLGPAWTFVPGQPETGVAESYLTFSSLATATAESPSALQAAYFGWLAWLFAIVTTVLVLMLSFMPSRVVAILCVVAGIVQALIVVLAVKGPLSWSAVIDALPETRLGLALVLGGCVLLIAAGTSVVRASAIREP